MREDNNIFENNENSILAASMCFPTFYIACVFYAIGLAEVMIDATARAYSEILPDQMNPLADYGYGRTGKQHGVMQTYKNEDSPVGRGLS